VQQALKTSGLKDDTTCVVVDIIPSDHLTSPQLSPKKNQNKLKSLFRRRSHSSVGKLGGKSASFGSVEELFEEGSAMLEERYVLIVVAMLYCICLFVDFLVITRYQFSFVLFCMIFYTLYFDGK
jgi:hypothetical protein